MDTWLIVLLFLITAPLWLGYAIVAAMLIGTAFIALCIGTVALAVTIWEAVRR